MQCLFPWEDGTPAAAACVRASSHTLSHTPLPMGVLELLQWHGRAAAHGQPSPRLGHAAGANTPPCPSKTDRRHGPPPTAKCFPPLFPLSLLSLQMHYWQACKPRWLQPLGEEGDPFPARFNQPHSLPCAALSSALTSCLETCGYRLYLCFQIWFFGP